MRLFFRTKSRIRQGPPVKTLKNWPQKLLIIGPDPFISHSSPDHSPQTIIDFSYYQISGPDICSLICEACSSCQPVRKAIAKPFRLKSFSVLVKSILSYSAILICPKSHQNLTDRRFLDDILSFRRPLHDPYLHKYLNFK